MKNSIISHHSTFCSQETSKPKHCWICCSTDDNDDYENKRYWVSPCKCRGSTQWVHQGCVQLWIDEKMENNLSDKPHCPQCKTQYIIVFDEVNHIVWLLNMLDKIFDHVCTYLTAVVIACVFYWSAVSYGVITIIQVMGTRKAITIMQNTNSYVLLLVLTLIPVSMILFETINWEETLLLFVLRFTSKLPLLKTIMPSFLCEPVKSSTSTDQLNSVRNSSATTLCAALVLPTTATIVGNLLFYNSSYSYLQKTLLGGLVYIAVKGVFRIYQRKHNVINKRTRRVIGYPETDTEENS